MAQGKRTAAALAALRTPGSVHLGLGPIGFDVPSGLLAAAGFAAGGGELTSGINFGQATAPAPPPSPLSGKVAGIPIVFLLIGGGGLLLFLALRK